MGFALDSFLLAHRDEIIREWEQAIGAHSSREVTLAASALRDHAPQFLGELAAWVSDGDSPALAERLRASAGAHAAQRLAHAYQLPQLIEEFRLLRATVLRRVFAAEALEQARSGARELPDRVVLLARLNDGFDLAIGGAVERFTRERERRLERLRGADEALRDREAFLRRVIDATPSMVFVKDAEGRFALANEALARLYGTTVEGIVGKTDADFNPDAEQVAAFHRDDREVMTTGREKLIPAEPVRTAAGEERWFATIKVPLVNRDGTCCDHVLGVATDITARMRAEEALRDANRQKDQFLAMLAHELRNPLAAIASAAQVIRTRLDHDDRVERPLEVLERQIRNSARLLDDLLDVSRITRGALHLKREVVRLDAIVASAIDAQRPLLDAAGHRLSVSLPREPVFLDADSTRLEQVVSNLLNNAAKYTPERGRIDVVVERRGPDALIRVIDSGAGIPAELLPRIFDTFVQAEQPLARTKGGLGLGLSLVRRLVEMHGGAIEAGSEGAGKGSEFVVRLPARASPPRTAPPASAPKEPIERQPSRRILLVEDNLDAAELLSEHLDSLGHDVHVAHDGPAALATAARVRPEVVLLDIGLPGLDGYEVARRLRATDLDPPPVIIAITGYGQDDDRKRSSEAGFAHHLTKPFEARVLERLLAEIGVEPPHERSDITH